MLIISKGWGTVLLFVFPFVFGLLVWIVGPADMDGNLSIGISLLLSTLPIWFSGRKLNSYKDVHVDYKTGERVESSPHTCFFIPIEYWAIASFLAGLYFVMSSSFFL